MGRIAVHEFTTLDGVIGAPTWTFDHPFDPLMGEAIGRLTAPATAILLGRRTYEQFAPAWSARTVDDDPGAPFFNETAKYVVSSTLTSADWNASTVLGRYDPRTIRELKEKVDGGIYVSGSGTLVRALLADGLVDELHLFVYPVAVGAGQQLFPLTGRSTTLRLVECQAYDSGVVHLAYALPATSGDRA